MFRSTFGPVGAEPAGSKVVGVRKPELQALKHIQLLPASPLISWSQQRLAATSGYPWNYLCIYLLRPTVTWYLKTREFLIFSNISSRQSKYFPRKIAAIPALSERTGWNCIEANGNHRFPCSGDVLKYLDKFPSLHTYCQIYNQNKTIMNIESCV